MGDHDLLIRPVCRPPLLCPEEESSFDASVSPVQSAFLPAQDVQALAPIPRFLPNLPLALPVQVQSEHCLQDSAEDLMALFETVRSNPQDFALTRILPQVLDHGDYEVELFARMIPGSYAGGLVVREGTMIDARISLRDGRLEGTIDFVPKGVVKVNAAGPIDATLSQLRLYTDAQGHIRCEATATFLNVRQDATADITQIFLGERRDFIPGPPSEAVRQIVAYFTRTGERPPQMVDPTAMSLRLVANPRPGDADVPPLDVVSHGAVRLDRLEIAPNFTLEDMRAGFELAPNEETGGYTLTVPQATLRRVHHAPVQECNGAPNPGLTLSELGLTDLSLNLVPIDPNNPLAGYYPGSGSGRVLMGGASLNDDVVFLPLTPQEPLRFDFTMQPRGDTFDLHARVQAPRLGVDRIGTSAEPLVFGGELLMGYSASLNADDAVISGLEATVDVIDLRNPDISPNIFPNIFYDARFSPALASSSVSVRNSDDRVLLTNSISNFGVDQPIHLWRSPGEPMHRFDISGLHVGSGSATWNVSPELLPILPFPISSSGSADFGIGGFDFGGALNQDTGVFSLDHMRLPVYRLNSETSVNGIRVASTLSNGDTIDGLASGLSITRDVEGPTAGLTHTMTINARTERLRIATPRGVFEVSGPLTGTMQLVDVAGAHQPPDFRPVAGSIRLRLKNQRGRIRLNGVPIGALGFGSDVTISDDARGRLTIGAATRLGGPIPSSSTARIVTDLSPHVVRFNTTGGSGPVSIPYYDPRNMDSLSIPSILLNLALPGGGQISLNGNASLSDLSLTNILSGDIRARYRLGGLLETPALRMETIAPRSGVRGTVRVRNGAISINGDERILRSSLRLPAIEVDLERTVDGVTYHVTGSLTPQATISSLVNLSDLSFSLPAQSHRLTGDLTVTATNEAGETVGSGTVALSSSYTLSASANFRRAHLNLTLPRTEIEARLTHPTRAGDMNLPAGTEITIPMEGFAVDIDADVGALLRAHGGRHGH